MLLQLATRWPQLSVALMVGGTDVNADMTAWREDLKVLLPQAGEQCQPTVFCLSDVQARHHPVVTWQPRGHSNAIK